jgi:hypothetical protein
MSLLTANEPPIDYSRRNSEDSDTRPILHSTSIPSLSGTSRSNWRSYFSLPSLSSRSKQHTDRNSQQCRVTLIPDPKEDTGDRESARNRRRKASYLLPIRNAFSAASQGIRGGFGHLKPQNGANSESEEEGDDGEDLEYWLKVKKNSPTRGKGNEGDPTHERVMTDATREQKSKATDSPPLPPKP